MKNIWRACARFVVSRWNGHVLLERIFWRDMLVVGTLVNLSAALLAVILLSLHAPAALAIAIFLAPLPYNFLLYVGVWLAAAQALPLRAAGVRTVATIWVVAAFLV